MINFYNWEIESQHFWNAFGYAWLLLSFNYPLGTENESYNLIQ